ncbi:MAG TPA: hypothetical protein V6D07_13740 [Trichocoleus sp.]
MTTSFQPTHELVSRSRKVPVMVVAGGERSQVFTEKEWLENRTPAFELHSKLGLFCRGVQVVGYQLESLTVTSDTTSSASTAA